MDLPFYQVDAFATGPFTGNPAAVMPLDHWLDDATLQAIAGENNLSETAFFVPGDGGADFDLRWFTPTVEVDLCGHATLASGHIVLALQPERDRVAFRTRRSGALAVARAGDRLSLDLPAWAPEPAEDARAAAALGVTPHEVLVRPGGYTVVVLGSADEVRALRPDFAALGRLGNILTIVTAPGDGGVDVVSRVFAPGAGIDEDPVTGAAHTVLTPYWVRRLGRDRFTALQASARGGRLDCRLEGDRVQLTGGCVTVIEGMMRI